ncbi:GNAT family N-acetyltransferase [Taklimakanibacter deserti]|uniref:GNAT family N-acetyltransferase n=1 Tax=Taklimakanibacter deserti TaxID=2267839 RepID=UPI000E64FC68
MTTLRPWSEADLPVLEACNTSEQKKYLGGPESPERLLKRNRDFAQIVIPGETRMFRIDHEGSPAGSIGYWRKEWRGETVYETGWAVMPHLQGRGIAHAATAALIAILRQEAQRRFLHAFPSPENLASNAICRKAGFLLQGEYDFEFPPGRIMRCNDWRFDLTG